MSSPSDIQAPAHNVPEADGATASGRHKRTSVPRWLPVTLLALTTAALAVPIVYLRRQRTSGVVRTLTDAPPPRRGLGVSTAGARPAASAAPPPPAPLPKIIAEEGPAPPSDGFNGALYCAKAFGLATLYVSVGAGLTVWGVQTFLGVHNAQEFGERMRAHAVALMPTLSARLYRTPEIEDDNPMALQDTSLTSQIHISNADDTAEWSWSEAEHRLKVAYEKDGFSGWAQRALQELEAERNAEKAKRDRL